MGTGPYGGPERFFRTPVTAPGPLGREMLRAAPLIRRDPLAFLVRTRARHGDVVQFPVPTPPSYLISDPAAVDRVLRVNARASTKRTVQYDALSLVTGRGLLTIDDPPWRDHRRVVQPAFHRGGVDAVASATAGALRRLDAVWSALPDGSVVDVDAAMMHLAIEVVGQALFGTDLSGDAAGLAGATLDALEMVVARARNPLAPPRRLPTPGNRRLDASLRTLDAAVERMLADRARRGPRDPSAPGDLLDLLIAARDDADPVRLSASDVRDEIVTFVVAGHETVASALTWAWHLLSADPAWTAALAEEADAVLGGRDPVAADVARLPVARAVLDEALRLYPPAWLITRSATEPDELAGHAVPAGALLIISPWLVHRHEAVWADPERFDPGRFLGEGRDAALRRAYLPFGLGPRLCIGRETALLEGVLVLAGLARRWRLEPAGPGPVHAEPVVTVRPRGGLPMAVRRR